jgi:Tol biopolymer transport system component
MSMRLIVVVPVLALGFAVGAHAGEARHGESAAPRSDFEIFSVGVDGKDRRNLSRNALDERNPVVSPNGRRIAFTRWGGSLDDPRTGIWLMKPDGSAQTKLAGTNLLAWPLWSPDGTRVAFSGGSYDPDGYTYAVVVLRLADGQLTTIEDASEPTWAPDGKRLAFLSDPIGSYRTGFRNLSVADADGTNRRKVFTLESPGISSPPLWSTRGSLVAVTFPGWSIHVIDTETGDERTVANPGWNPSWSPDGRRIAFALYRGIGVTQVAQPRTRLLVSSRHGSVTPRRPVWSPDGRSLAFITKHQLRVVDVASGRFRVVTQSSTGLSAPVWSPSGRRLYFTARLPA